MNLTDTVNKNKNMIINLAIVIVAAVFAFNIHKAQTLNTKNLKAQKEIEEKKNVILVDINKLAKEYSDYNNLLGVNDIPTLINNIGEIAKGSGIKIVSIKPIARQSQALFIKSPFDLTISAESYHSIGLFVSKLESSPNIYMIDYIDIKSAKDGAKQILNASIRVSALGGKK
jgi:Tfp pilus assembly protein PilO